MKTTQYVCVIITKSTGIHDVHAWIHTNTHAQDVGVRPKQCIITRLAPFFGIYHAQFIEDPFRDHTAHSPTGERKQKKKKQGNFIGVGIINKRIYQKCCSFCALNIAAKFYYSNQNCAVLLGTLTKVSRWYLSRHESWKEFCKIAKQLVNMLCIEDIQDQIVEIPFVEVNEQFSVCKIFSHINLTLQLSHSLMRIFTLWYLRWNTVNLT